MGSRSSAKMEARGLEAARVTWPDDEVHPLATGRVASGVLTIGGTTSADHRHDENAARRPRKLFSSGPGVVPEALP